MQNSCSLSPSVDTSSLRAALSVIDDWELDFGFLFGPTGDVSPDAPEEKSSPRRRLSSSTSISTGDGEEPSRAPYKGRNRRKLEILALREHAERLQHQLDMSKRIANEVAIAHAAENGEEEQELQGLEGVWEDLSRRQLMQRQFAEAENSALRADLVAHIQTARQLLSITRKALKGQGLLPRPIEEGEYFDNEFIPAAEHLAQVEELFYQATAVFSQPPYDSGRRDFQNIQMTEDGTGGMVINFEVSLLLPFDVDGVADALFQHTTRMSSNDRVYEFKDILRPDVDSLVSLFAGLSTLNDIEGTMQGQIATKKFTPTADSALVVSKVYADVLKTDLLPFRMSGEGWLRCVEVHRGLPTTGDGSAPKTSPLTHVQWFRRIRIRPLNASRAPAWSDLHGSIATRVKHNLDWNLQAVENLLLAQSRRKYGTFLHPTPQTKLAT